MPRSPSAPDPALVRIEAPRVERRVVAPVLQVTPTEVADLPERALVDQLAREPHRGYEAVVEPAQMLDPGRGDAAPHVVALVGRPPERLLAEDVLAGFGGGDRRLGMERVRATVVEEPDSLVRDDVVPVGRPALVAVSERRLGDRIPVPPGDGDEPWHERGRPGQVLHLAERVRVRLPHECVTEHADADLCHWRDSTPVSERGHIHSVSDLVAQVTM